MRESGLGFRVRCRIRVRCRVRVRVKPAHDPFFGFPVTAGGDDGDRLGHAFQLGLGLDLGFGLGLRFRFGVRLSVIIPRNNALDELSECGHVLLHRFEVSFTSDIALGVASDQAEDQPRGAPV